ncbi:MAG: response regulator [Gemmatimonadetes bacterium]|nr:response regulator [Gemmatimonadota bacterium]NIQ54215.1 response regulator [Gemmatimonadota bacterium]NIU74418.1 response regulator [Gammaproteobacteria bacterium]NIX44404.1 response regulator [Gemmatimonadota bacterium]NIY08620.1 response regulator [Gemmatimonadota bacterium]
MDGEIGVESTVGEGSTFWFELPLDLTRTGPPQAHAPPAKPVAEPTDPVRRFSVLYIEDNPSNFRLVERILAHRPGTELVTAMTGSRGLELARRRRPDLILLDLHLPDMHGSEVMREIRKDSTVSRTPVVIISADVTSDGAQELMNDGAQAYLPKPLDVKEFLRVVDQVVDS